MDKEKIATIFIGLVVGAGLASAYFLSAKFLPGQNKPRQEIISTQKTDNNNVVVQGLTLTQPDDNSSTADSSVLVAGKAPAGQMVILYANADEKVAFADANGAFSANIKLEEGMNEISATITDASGKPTTVKREIIMEVTP